MDIREIEILRHFEAGSAAVKPLLNRLPKSTVYRMIEKLLEERLLVKDGTSYRITGLGLESLEGAATPAPAEDRPASLEKHLPHLRHAPTDFHKAVLELIACAVVARRHRIRQSHHPAFVVFGPKLKWKTWIAKAACHLAGAKPERDVIYLGTESGRSMLMRKGAKGQRVSVRGALDKPVVGLDEYLRARPDVRQLVQVYLFGELSVPDENEVLTIEPVPVVTLNPRADKVELDERVGLDEAMLRRSIVADLTNVELPAHLLAEGDVLLDRIQAAGAAEFPAPSWPKWEPRDEVKELLLAALDGPERLAGIDITMLAMLATAATAWLPPEEALRLVITDYVSIVAQLGWAKPDWRTAMTATTNPTSALETTTVGAAAEPNPLDFDAKLRALSDLCARLGLGSAEAEERLRRMEGICRLGFTIDGAAEVAAEFRRVGVTPADGARAIAERVRECGSLAASRDRLESEVDTLEAEVADAAKRVADAKRDMAALGWDPARVAGLRTMEARLSREAIDLGQLTTLIAVSDALAELADASSSDGAALARNALETLAHELREAGVGADLPAAIRLVAAAGVRGVRAVTEAVDAEDALAALREEEQELIDRRDALQLSIESADRKKAEVQAHVAQAQAQLAEGKRALAVAEAMRAKVIDERRVAAAEIAFATELIQFLYGHLGTHDQLWSALTELARKRTQSGLAAAPRVAQLSSEVRVRILDVLRHTVDRDIVPRWEIESFKRDAHRAALQQVKAELAPAEKLLKSYESAVQSHRLELELVMSKLRPGMTV